MYFRIPIALDRIAHEYISKERGQEPRQNNRTQDAHGDLKPGGNEDSVKQKEY